MHIRPAQVTDAKELLAIYAPYVEKTAITFEYDVPSLSEFAERIANTLKKYPYLVAEEDGQILGYAYASPFKGRWKPPSIWRKMPGGRAWAGNYILHWKMRCGK